MNGKLLAVSVAMAALVATVPVSAQSVSGSVAVQGFVAARCATGFTGGTTFSGTINLGELSNSTGAMSQTMINSTTNSPVGVAEFLVGCTGPSFSVTLSADRLTNPLLAAEPPASSTIDYTAEAKIALAAGGFATIDYTTAAALPAPTVTTVDGYAANAAHNFEVRVFGFHPENGDSSVLVAGDYSSTIAILVSPSP